MGEWRGVGQPKRGSNQGPWAESCRWAWHFFQELVELVAQLSDDKYFSRLRLQTGPSEGQFVPLATPKDASPSPNVNASERFTGRLASGVLEVVADSAQSDRPARISQRLAAGSDRMLVLLERRVAEDDFVLLAEVGSTRQGSSFAQKGAAGRECIVTGGLGTIAVQHRGKKYFVCCSGCRDYFLDHADDVLAEYRKRRSLESDNINP